ncbi:hypothetical protein [Paenarthrobacter nitroguajacolicus]|uniref:hypothetical protein n=1 Tax=Paenarthrobacter nitroguajacolicus TaxID=211146 RepID=UPI00248B3B01|nr:hypothetical protein [Paenarthrobacter nitroguajacolicus]MDI2033348.1 hypothetical protein [Paenarthrobacter nitroguajacolicus]
MIGHKQYTVRATPAAQEAGAVALAVASLPESFGPATEGAADIQVIDGQSGWSTQAQQAIDGGARGIVVVNPAPENTDRLQSAAGKARTVVVLDQRWASSPAVPGAEDAVRSMAGRAAVLDSVATAGVGTDSAELLADHLAAVVRVAGPLANLRILARGPHGYTATAVLANDAPAALQGAISSARPAGVNVTLLTDDGGVTVTLPEPVAAWPATVKVTGPQGELILPTIYESAHRATWRRLKEHLDAGTLPADLHRFAALTAAITALN